MTGLRVIDFPYVPKPQTSEPLVFLMFSCYSSARDRRVYHMGVGGALALNPGAYIYIYVYIYIWQFLIGQVVKKREMTALPKSAH